MSSSFSWVLLLSWLLLIPTESPTCTNCKRFVRMRYSWALLSGCNGRVSADPWIESDGHGSYGSLISLFSHCLSFLSTWVTLSPSFYSWFLIAVSIYLLWYSVTISSLHWHFWAWMSLLTSPSITSCFGVPLKSISLTKRYPYGRNTLRISRKMCGNCYGYRWCKEV